MQHTIISCALFSIHFLSLSLPPFVLFSFAIWHEVKTLKKIIINSLLFDTQTHTTSLAVESLSNRALLCMEMCVFVVIAVTLAPIHQSRGVVSEWKIVKLYRKEKCTMWIRRHAFWDWRMTVSFVPCSAVRAVCCVCNFQNKNVRWNVRKKK